ncbi:MAG: glycosyltransferase family 2 protein [Streptococcaceae bacterium]|nr:glycosyltransferase family 2 protein [Streptococcaceae bacterium]
MVNYLLRNTRRYGIFKTLFLMISYIPNKKIEKKKIKTINEHGRVNFGKSENYQLNSKKRTDKIIVSMTTIPGRMKFLKYPLDAIFQQTLPPDEVHLYLDVARKEKYPISDLDVFIRSGLKIFYVEDLRPHTKYFYAIKENSDALVVTIDDDIWYERNLIEVLYNSYKKFPNAVSAMRAHRITATRGKIDLYDDWEFESHYSNKPEADLFATGVGGVLYPPHTMNIKLFDKTMLKELSFYNDDLWLKVMQDLNGTKVVVPSAKKHLVIDVEGSQEISLNSVNVHDSRNDIYIKQLINAFPKAVLFPFKKDYWLPPNKKWTRSN